VGGGDSMNSERYETCVVYELENDRKEDAIHCATASKKKSAMTLLFFKTFYTSH